MGSVVGPLESLGRQVGIDLRGHQVRVAKQLLHAAEVRTRIEQMGRIAVPKLVRCQVRIKTCRRQVFFEP